MDNPWANDTDTSGSSGFSGKWSNPSGIPSSSPTDTNKKTNWDTWAQTDTDPPKPKTTEWDAWDQETQHQDHPDPVSIHEFMRANPASGNGHDNANAKGENSRRTSVGRDTGSWGVDDDLSDIVPVKANSQPTRPTFTSPPTPNPTPIPTPVPVPTRTPISARQGLGRDTGGWGNEEDLSDIIPVKTHSQPTFASPSASRASMPFSASPPQLQTHPTISPTRSLPPYDSLPPSYLPVTSQHAGVNYMDEIDAVFNDMGINEDGERNDLAKLDDVFDSLGIV